MASRSKVASATARLVSLEFNHGMKGVTSPRVSCISRVNGRLTVPARFLASMIPLHSAIAKARLTSVLSPESQTWVRLPLGLSMPL